MDILLPTKLLSMYQNKIQRVLISLVIIGFFPLLKFTLNHTPNLSNSELSRVLDISMYSAFGFIVIFAIFYNVYLLIQKNSTAKERFRSICFLIIGIIIPLIFKYGIFKDEEESHLPFWITIDLFSGTLFFVLELLYKYLNKILYNQEKNLRETTRSISEKLNAENSIIKISLGQHLYLDNYFKKLRLLHDSVNNKINNFPILIPFIYQLLNDGTENLFNFFEEKKFGVYRVERAVSFYEKISEHSKSITIFEPVCPDDYNTKYTAEYISFIRNIGKNKNILTQYFYLQGNPKSKTWKWLEEATFHPKLKSIAEGKNAKSEWDQYSHLIFELDSLLVSCSVMPFFNKNFKEADDVYLAYRVLNNPDSTDELLEYLRKITRYQKK